MGEFLWDVTTPITHGGVSQLVFDEKRKIYYTTGRRIAEQIAEKKSLPGEIKGFLLNYILWHGEYVDERGTPKSLYRRRDGKFTRSRKQSRKKQSKKKEKKEKKEKNNQEDV